MPLEWLSEWRWRVICMMPSVEMGRMWFFALSAAISRFIRLQARRIAIFLRLHVYEVEDDETANITQAHLAAISVAASRFT